jgi:hypothetical protein
MESSDPKDLAMTFLHELAHMPRERLQELIRTRVGEDLAAIMFNYAKMIMESDPARAVENGSSLMILGYLIRVHEEGNIQPDGLPA